MERLSQGDAEAVMGVVQQAVFGILQQAAERLEFPIKVTAACSTGICRTHVDRIPRGRARIHADGG